MIAFQVNDMTCGHCVSSITKAVKAADKDATVRIDLASHRVEIEPAGAGATELGDAIRQAGYTPVVVADAPAASAAPKKSGRCCCG